jgi:uncharacterized protein (TIGR00725 family)
VPRPVIGVVGASRASPAHLADARDLGRRIAEAGWILLTGGRDAGVMAAATEGAKTVPGSLTVGILPERDSVAAPGLDVVIVTGMGDARNVINVLSSRVVVACGVEGAGTASEIALALKSGVPVVLLRADPEAVALFGGLGRSLVHQAASPDEAVRVIRDVLEVPPGPSWGKEGRERTREDEKGE